MRKKWAKNRENYPAENSTKECGVGDNCMVSKVTWVRELLWLQFLSQLVLIEQSLSLNVITHHHIIKWLCLAYNLHKFNTIHQHPIHACNIWSEAQHAINDFVLHLVLYKVCRAIRLLRLYPFQRNNQIKNSSAYTVMDVARTNNVSQENDQVLLNVVQTQYVWWYTSLKCREQVKSKPWSRYWDENQFSVLNSL